MCPTFLLQVLLLVLAQSRLSVMAGRHRRPVDWDWGGGGWSYKYHTSWGKLDDVWTIINTSWREDGSNNNVGDGTYGRHNDGKTDKDSDHDVCEVGTNNWTYSGRTGPEFWGEIGFKNCDRKMQSPINLDSSLAERSLKVGSVTYNNYNTVTSNNIQLRNTGDTVQLDLLGESPAIMSGQGLVCSLILLSCVSELVVSIRMENES